MPLGFLLDLSAPWVPCTYSVVASFMSFGKYFYGLLPLSWGFLRSWVLAFIYFLKFIYLFVCFWLHWVFVAARGLSLVAARGFLIAVASLVAEHGL